MLQHFYRNLKSLFVFLFFITTQITASAQIEFSLHLLPDSSSWAVYARADSSVSISNSLQLASGQVTIVTSTGTQIQKCESRNGKWVKNARYNRPFENPEFDYIPFGYSDDFPINAFLNKDTILLFTVKFLGCPDSIALMDHGDPYARPNSHSSNPENDFSGFDQITGNIIQWTDNYTTCNSNCNVCKEEEDNISNNKDQKATPISIYPNPSNGIVYFNGFENSISKIIVRNIYGQTVGEFINPERQIDLNSLAQGSYFIFFENDKEALIQPKRVILQK